MSPITPLMIVTLATCVFFYVFMVMVFIDLLSNKIQELKLKVVMLDNAMLAVKTTAIILAASLLAVTLKLVIDLTTPYFN